MSFIKINNILYFSYDYNDIFTNEIISIMKECDTIYFNNYDDNEICFETNNLFDYEYNVNYKKTIFQIH